MVLQRHAVSEPATNFIKGNDSVSQLHLLFKDQSMDSYIRYCTGNSMAPTLRHGEAFCLSHVTREDIRCGDILLFRRPNNDKDVVHRVVRGTASGFMTRGDKASNTKDPWIVTDKEIIGKVEIVYRSGKPHRLSQGGMGLLWHYSLRTWRQVVLGLRPLIYPFYRLSSRWCYLGWILPPKLKPEIIKIRHKGQDTYTIVSGSRKIGSKAPEDATWQIHFPWHYVIREKNLFKTD